MRESRRGRDRRFVALALLLAAGCASNGASPSGKLPAGAAATSRGPAVIGTADLAGEGGTLGLAPGRTASGARDTGTADGVDDERSGGLAAPQADPHATAEERFGEFARRILALVNRDRQAAREGALTVDPEAARFAQAEAARLVTEGRFDHHAADGSKPYQRWSRGGGTARVAENLYRLTAREGRAYMLFDPADAHARLMRSAGHRRNVLDPMHTGAGVAVAFDPAHNSVVVVEEFVDRHVVMEPGDRVWRTGESRALRGRVLEVGALVPWLAVLYREPPPGSEAARREAVRHAYTEGSDDAALILSGSELGFDRESGEFTLHVRVPAAAPPGPYTLVLYVVPRERAARGGRRSSEGAWPVTQLAYEVVR